MRLLASFEWSFIWDNSELLWQGFKNTIKVSAIGIVGSSVIGLVLGAVRAHRIPVLNQLAVAYVELIRNTPILVQIFFLYYMLPAVPGEINGVTIPFIGDDGIQLETFTVAWLSITIWGGAFNTENFRAGFEAVPKRLREAGLCARFHSAQDVSERDAPDRWANRASFHDQHVHLGSEEHLADARHRLPGADDRRRTTSRRSRFGPSRCSRSSRSSISPSSGRCPL